LKNGEKKRGVWPASYTRCLFFPFQACKEGGRKQRNRKKRKKEKRHLNWTPFPPIPPSSRKGRRGGGGQVYANKNFVLVYSTNRQGKEGRDKKQKREKAGNAGEPYLPFGPDRKERRGKKKEGAFVFSFLPSRGREKRKTEKRKTGAPNDFSYLLWAARKKGLQKKKGGKKRGRGGRAAVGKCRPILILP